MHINGRTFHARGDFPMLLRSTGLLAALTVTAFATHANNLDINLGSNAVAVNYSAGLTNTGLEGDIGYLHHTDSVDIGDVGLQVVGDSNPAGSPFIFAVGGKLFLINPKQNYGNGTVLGLGGRFNYTWPTYNRFQIGGELYYAPSIVSFNNADSYLQFGVNAGYEILRNAELYVGYRHISASFTHTGTLTLDSTFMVGLNLSF
jgi:YfaZ precursor